MWEPGRIGSGTGGGKAAMGRVQSKAADGINGGFAEDDGRHGLGWDGEEAQIFAGAWSHAAPATGGGSPEFSADGDVMGVVHQENGIGASIGIQGAGFDEGIKQGWRQAAVVDQVVCDPSQLVWGREWDVDGRRYWGHRLGG